MAVQFDLENERSIITAALKDPEARRMAVGSISPEDFLGERFKIIFRAIAECHKQRLQPDADAIAVYAEGEDFGGLEFVKRLQELDPPANLEFHLSRLKRDAVRTKVKKIELPELDRMLADKTVEHVECLQKIIGIQNLMRAGAYSGDEDVALKWNKELDKRCAGEARFQSVGYETLDSILIDGYAKKSVSVIAARTGNGKTTMLVDTVRRLLESQNKPKICVLPLEIGQIRFLDKLVSSATLVPTLKLRKTPEELTLAEREEFKRVTRKLVGTDDRLTVLDNPFFGLPEWTNESALDKLEEILAEGGFDMLFMDLFQRCLTDLRPGSIESALVRVQHMAKMYDTHLGLLHQVSRKAEEKKDKRPALDDLKGSGGYEEIPDLIMLLHRPKAYKQFRRKDEIEIMLAKQRDGEAAKTVIADFYPMVSRLDKDRFPAVKQSEREEEEEDEGDTSFNYSNH